MKKKIHSITFILALLAVLPMVFVALIALLVSEIQLTENMKDSYRNTIQSVAFSLLDSYDLLYEGDWHYDNDMLCKGNNDVSDTQALLDDLKNEKGFEVTIFYGDVRVMTTLKDDNGNYIVGTKADEKVSDIVLNQKEVYFDDNLVVNGKTCYVCYEPLTNEDGSVAGMLFIGYPRTDVEMQIRSAAYALLVTVFFIVVIGAIVATIVARKLSHSIRRLTQEIMKLGSGDLNIHATVTKFHSKNELGMLCDNINGLAEHLSEIVNGISVNTDILNGNAEQLVNIVQTTDSAIENVNTAIEEVSLGSASQAEDTSNAMSNIKSLNDNLDDIELSVNNLAEKSDNTAKTSQNAKNTMEQLLEINGKTQSDIDNIVKQSEKNVQAVKYITTILQTIESIADQTNLLSLNASIEAARAGESGRGFAVVAGEIGSLATECANASQDIQKIVDELVQDLQETSRYSDILNSSAVEQVEKLQNTSTMFEQVMNDVKSISDEAINIKAKVEGISNEKNTIGSTLESLSAISEENAAASQETTSSASLVLNDIKKIEEASKEVSRLSGELKQLISFFKKADAVV